MRLLEQIVNQANSIVWSWPPGMPLLVVLLVGTGVFLTLRFGFINLRGFGHAVRVVRGVYDDPNDPGDITHFQALTTALSATVGIGNIAGVAIAIHHGGPGALFWMWVTAALGMTTKFTECTLALAFRRKYPDGSVSGGPMYYIEAGLKLKPLALFFASCVIICSFGAGNAVQAFTMADQVRDTFGLPTWITGGCSAVLVALVILGGIARIGNFTSRIVPLMAGLYVSAAILVLVLNLGGLPAAFKSIVLGAFSPSSAIGGFAGATLVYTVTWGVKRGLFSNEAGQGSAPIAHAAARTNEPVREGSVALLEPFIDTLVICSLTGLMIVTTGVWQEKKETTLPLNAQSNIQLVHPGCEMGRNGTPRGPCQVKTTERFTVTEGRVEGARFIVNHAFVDQPMLLADGKPANGTLGVTAAGYPALLGVTGGTLRGAALHNSSLLTAWAFDRGLARILPENFPFGAYLISIAVFLFALSTAIGWSYYGDRGAQYLAGPRAVTPYRLAFVAMHLVGAIVPLDVVWNFGDTALGLMSFPNLIAILLLSGRVRRMMLEYFAKSHVPVKKQ